MTSDPREPAELILYGKPGCHLCEEARSIVEHLLAARRAAGLPSPTLLERNILTDASWQRAYFETIPVLSLDGRELPLAIRPAQIRAFLDTALAPAAR